MLARRSTILLTLFAAVALFLLPMMAAPALTLSGSDAGGRRPGPGE